MISSGEIVGTAWFLSAIGSCWNMYRKGHFGCVLIPTILILGPFGFFLTILMRNLHDEPAKPKPQPKAKKTSSTPLSFAIAAFITMGVGLFVYVEQRPPTPTSRYQPVQMFKPTKTAPPTRRPTPTNVRVISLTPRRITPTPLPYTTSHSNVRSGPGTHYPPITQIPANTKITPTGRNATGSWIKFTSPNSSGWIYTPLTTLTNTSRLPLVTTPPAPTTAPQPQPTKLTSPPTHTPPPAQHDTFLPGNCRDLIAAGKVPLGGWPTTNANYTASRDRDNDGKACDNP